MEQLTFFDLQNDPSIGSFCDCEEELSPEETLARLEEAIKLQEAREAYVRALAPDAYSLTASAPENRTTLTLEELLLHISSVREKRLAGVDLSQPEETILPVEESLDAEDESGKKANAKEESEKGLFSFAKEQIKLFFAGAPKWFDGRKPVGKTNKKFPISVFAAVGVLATCLSLIVGGSILVNHGESVNNKLKKELSQMSLQIEELQSELHLTNDVLLIRELAKEECGMIGEEYVRTETLSLGDGESVETYPDGKAEGVGLSTLLSAIGIKK